MGNELRKGLISSDPVSRLGRSRNPLSCYASGMIGDAAELTEAERAWLVKDEETWRRARDIASQHPGMDSSGVYHVLRNLEKTPSDRLRAALSHGRLFGIHAR